MQFVYQFCSTDMNTHEDQCIVCLKLKQGNLPVTLKVNFFTTHCDLRHNGCCLLLQHAASQLAMGNGADMHLAIILTTVF